MRYDAEHKQRTRQKVIAEAAAAIRKHGPEGIGVADLMAKAGLTHGGFYAHFKSKDELVTEALGEMFDERYGRLLTRIDGMPPAEALASLIDRYVCATHRDKIQGGCPMPTLSGDVARLPVVTRERFEAGNDRLTRKIAQLLTDLGRPKPEQLAKSVLAEMVGAVALSRAVADAQTSDDILEASRTALRQRIGLKEP